MQQLNTPRERKSKRSRPPMLPAEAVLKAAKKARVGRVQARRDLSAYEQSGGKKFLPYLQQ